MSLFTNASPGRGTSILDGIVDLRKSTKNISNSFVADNSSEHTYIPKLQLFIMYLLDNNKREYINPNILEDMIKADAIDRENHKELMDRRKNKKSNKAKSTIPKRTKLRNYIYECIVDTPPDVELNKLQTSPIKIDGDGAITAAVVKEYMQTNMKQVSVARDAAEAYLKEINRNVQITDDMVDDKGKVKCSVYQSKSQYNGIRSSIAYLFTLARVIPPEVMQKEIATFLKGMDRTIRAEKEKLGLKISEGKKPLSFEAYSLMAKHLFMSGNIEDLFAHVFLIFDWCLMKRAENCVNAQINHIHFGNDCLVFEFAKSKGHQAGEDHVGPWHVYANLKDGQPLFAGNGKSVYNRYSDRFHKLILELEGQLSNMGFEIGDLGTHSSRKGVATMVAAGCTVSPPIISICIRCGWAMGGVKDKYLLYGCAGDQYVGRCASGLDQTIKEFAISPPYFDYSTLELNEKIRRKNQVKEFIDIRIGYKEGGAISASARALIGWCFASICYHYEDLKEKYLHPDSTLRMTSLFKDIPEDITSLAVVKYPWNKTEDTPVSSGVPVHVLHMADMYELQLEMKDLKQEVKDLKTSLMDGIRKEMDSRGFGSSEHNTGQIMELIASVTAKQTEALTNMMNRLTEKTNLTATSYQETVAAAAAAEHEDFEMEEEELVECDIPANATPEQAQQARQNTLRKSNEIVAKRRYKVGIVKHNGKAKFSILPPSFKFPTMTPEMLIENWFVGNVSANIPPFCILNRQLVSHISTADAQLRKMRRVMKFVEKTAKENGCWNDKLSIKSYKGWDITSVKALWAGIEKDFKKKYGGKTKKSKNELSWTTCYNNMSGK